MRTSLSERETARGLRGPSTVEIAWRGRQRLFRRIELLRLSHAETRRGTRSRYRGAVAASSAADSIQPGRTVVRGLSLRMIEHAEVGDCEAEAHESPPSATGPPIDRRAFDEQNMVTCAERRRASHLAPEPSAADRAMQDRIPVFRSTRRLARPQVVACGSDRTSHEQHPRSSRWLELLTSLLYVRDELQTATCPVEWRPILRRNVANQPQLAISSQARMAILGIETSCDETAAAVVSRGRRDPLERRRLAGRAARALRRRRARGRLAPPPRARHAGDRAGARRRRSDARRRRRGRRHDAAGADRRAARRRLRGEGARVVAAPAADPRQPPARPRRVALPAAARPRAAVHLPARERRAHDAARRARTAARTACSGRRSTTPRARRSTRARGCSASATRAGARSTRSRGRATRPRTTSRSRGCRGSTSPSRA